MNRFRSLLLNGKYRFIALISMVLVVIGVVYFAYTTDLAALLALTIILVFAASSAVSSCPTDAEIAECSAAFIERAANILREKLFAFKHLYYTEVTVQGGTSHLLPRWEWQKANISGLPILKLGYLYTGQKRIPAEELQECLHVLQGLLADDGKRGLLGLPLYSSYAEGLPALHLLDIQHDGSYLVFSFVYVDSEKIARKVHEYGAPRWNGDSDDQDF